MRWTPAFPMWRRASYDRRAHRPRAAALPIDRHARVAAAGLERDQNIFLLFSNHRRAVRFRLWRFQLASGATDGAAPPLSSGGARGSVLSRDARALSLHQSALRPSPVPAAARGAAASRTADDGHHGDGDGAVRDHADGARLSAAGDRGRTRRGLSAALCARPALQLRSIAACGLCQPDRLGAGGTGIAGRTRGAGAMARAGDGLHHPDSPAPPSRRGGRPAAGDSRARGDGAQRVPVAHPRATRRRRFGGGVGLLTWATADGGRRPRRPFYPSTPQDSVALAEEAEAILAEAWPADPRKLLALAGPGRPDLATMLLYRACHRGENGAFLGRLATMPVGPAPIRILIVPGFLFAEHPELAIDGKLIRDIARRLGAEAEIADVDSRGLSDANGKRLAARLVEGEQRPTWMFSLSKGTSDARAALHHLGGWPRGLAGWVDLSGIFSGTPIADWWTDETVRRWLLKAFFGVNNLPFG